MNVDDAVARMRRRREGIAAAREQFRRLPAEQRTALEYGFWLAEEEARTVLRYRRPE